MEFLTVTNFWAKLRAVYVNFGPGKIIRNVGKFQKSSEDIKKYEIWVS